jgi:thioredoxin reductase (NADPH)
MTTVIIIGDGPAGLSAALFLAKNGCDTHVFGKDTTSTHKALLLNYLGIERMTGTDFQNIARAQVEHYGARLYRSFVTGIEKTEEGFRITTEEQSTYTAKYLVLASGPRTTLGARLGLATDERGFIIADRNGATSVAGVYAAGWSARPDKIQAIISAGEGAAAALDILSREKGKDLHDFDTP